jgi:hypothetical protein
LRKLAPAELFFALMFASVPDNATEDATPNGSGAYFFSHAAKASAKARSPGGPFSNAKMARPPLV